MIWSSAFKVLFLLVITISVLGKVNGDVLERRIYSGNDLNPEQNKHLVKLDFVKLQSTVFGGFKQRGICSGSIISASWILTSAHCFEDDIVNIDVLRQEEDQLLKIAEVKKYFEHPGYVDENDSPKNVEKDLALAMTRNPIQFDENFQPIKLAKRSIKFGQLAIVAGFGKTEHMYPGPRQGIVKLGRCFYTLGTSLLCSNSAIRAGPGDSGGSLVSKGQIVGVTTRSCTDVHIFKRCETIYVNVARHLGWIENVTGIQSK